MGAEERHGQNKKHQREGSWLSQTKGLETERKKIEERRRRPSQRGCQEMERCCNET
jgi:hypothetical protein